MHILSQKSIFIQFFLFILNKKNVLKFSDLVKDVLVSSSSEPVIQPYQQSSNKLPKSCSTNSNLNTKISFDELEHANLVILNNLQQKFLNLFFSQNFPSTKLKLDFNFPSNYSLMNESFPPLDIFTPDDDTTIKRIIDYLEEFQRKRDALIHVSSHFSSKPQSLISNFMPLTSTRKLIL